ncbi:MAG: hypothetical protein IPK03_05845 [Bacteroidetes bacterium]|nr:hypothetical protein [Bacteroidota bacterium]
MPLNLTNCDPKPFMKLQEDNSQAPILNYNMEANNNVSVYSYVPIPLDQEIFKPRIDPIPPKVNELMALSDSVIKQKLLEDLNSPQSIYFRNYKLLKNCAFPCVFYDASASSQPYIKAASYDINIPTLPIDTPLNHPSPLYNTKSGNWGFVFYIGGNYSMIKYGSITISADVLEGGFWLAKTLGDKTTVEFSPEIVIDFDINDIVSKLNRERFRFFNRMWKAESVWILVEIEDGENPIIKDKAFFLQYETIISSFLGNYGAGKTIETFSLLPGERTTISISTYKDRAESYMKTDNIIDTNSTAGRSLYESAVQDQNGTQESNSTSVGVGITTNSESGTGLIAGLFASGSSSSAFTADVKSSKLTNTIDSVVSNSLFSVTNQTNSAKQTNINTTVANSNSDSTTTSIIRELENINSSRTLNFVFRELVQEYNVIHWLKNIKFGYTDLQTGEVRLVFAHELEKLLNDVILDPLAANDLFLSIMDCARVIFNYDEDPITFFEPRPYPVPSASYICGSYIFPSSEDCLWVKTRGLSDTYGNVTLPGVILSVNNYKLKTSSVIVDSLLGQGEALDCYNKNLQQVNLEAQDLLNANTVLRNAQLQQAMDVINMIPDPIEKAAKYKEVFGTDCCKETETI